MAAVESRGGGDRSALALMTPSSAPSTINDIKTTGIPLNLRAQGISGASLNAWGVGGNSLGSVVSLGIWGDQDIRASPNTISVLLIYMFLI
jgi:hypothetical protein